MEITTKHQRTVRDRIFKVLPYFPLIIAAIIMIIPYYWMIIGAFKSISELQAVPPKFYIEEPTLDNFYNTDWDEGILQTQQIQGLFNRYTDTAGGFMRYYGNTLFIAITNTFLGVVIASIAAYVFAKHRFPGRNLLFLLVLSSMMIPWQVTLIPSFIIVRDLGWIGNFLGVIIPAASRPFELFFLRQYIQSAIPDDLVEAARVDGASEVRIWAQVVIPLIIPAMIAMSIFIFIGEWNNLIWPLIVLGGTQDMRTLPIVMSTMVDPFSPPFDMGMVMAAALIVSLPTLIMFLLFQKQFVRGIALTGVKG